MPGGNHAEEHGGRHGERSRVRKHGGVHVDGVGARQHAGAQHLQRVDAPAGEQHSEPRARQRQQQALRKEQSEETRAPGAQRGAHRHFPAPPQRARQQHVGHVGARDQSARIPPRRTAPAAAAAHSPRRLPASASALRPCCSWLRGTASPGPWRSPTWRPAPAAASRRV